MYRTNTCGELRLADARKEVTLAGWVQRSRKMGGMTFIDLRDRYGLTQIVFNNADNAELCEQANHLGREYVVQVTGTVAERSAKNPALPTGDIEIIAGALKVLNPSEVPPFTIEDETDGGDDLRMKFRYLDLRRPCVRKNLELRHKMTMEVRRYLDSKGFLEIETPMLVGSTPEGARDFVVPSRMNPGQFYALPQSPQTLKQLLMVSGMDRYFQIVKCFRDEDLRADRQPEFTQIDCEMSYVSQEDVISLFEGMAKHLFKELRGVEITEPFIRMPWADAMRLYGSDKPDLRFGMEFVELMDIMKGHGFGVFDSAEYIGGICAKGAASYTRKQLDNVRNNREFDLLSKEVEFQTLEIELCEKHIGEYTRNIDNRTRDIEVTEEKISDTEHVLAEKRAELEEIVNETRQDEERLRQQAKDLEPMIDARTLNAFKRIRKNARNGLGVVYIQRNACGGCFNRIPPQKQLEIKMRKKIIVCEYCGRILVDPAIAGIGE